MRNAVLLLALALAVPGAALAHDHVSIGRCEIHRPARFAERHYDGRFAIHTPGREATMLLTPRVVAVQLDDRVLHQVDREMRHELRDQDGECFLGRAIARVVVGSVRSMIARSIECPIRELRDVRYRDGRLELIARNGRRVFEHLEVNGGELLEGFRPGDAIAFVEEFHRIRGD